MATILNMMIGELESSHSEVGPAAGNPSSQTSAHLGFLIDYSYDGPGIKIKEVPAKAPGSYAKSKLSAGEIVTKINSKLVKADESLYRDVLNEQVGRDLVMTSNTVRSRAASSAASSGTTESRRDASMSRPSLAGN
jgi:S1-C subfamily serine protease